MRLAIAQISPIVGDLSSNLDALRTAYRDAVEQDAVLVAAGELALTGYPPEDLVLRPSFLDAVSEHLEVLAAGTGAVPLVVGFVERLSGGDDTHGWRSVVSSDPSYPALANAAAVCRGGRVEAIYRKQRLPNYGVFDEARYFRAGTQPLVFEVGGARVGVTICEDLWGKGGPARQAQEAGAELLLNLNASPYSRGKRAERERRVRRHATACGTWIAYVHVSAGQDEVVFDGDSFLMAPDGTVTARAKQFAPDLLVTDVPLGAQPPYAPAADPRLDPLSEVYAALVLGTRDYVERNGFPGALIGLSGGIDSSLVAAIACDALGPERVTGVAMPSPYSSSGSLTDARALAEAFGMRYIELPITGVMKAFEEVLAEPFAGAPPDIAEENIQSRIRGSLVMALSNKWGDIVLTTGNKSEYAVGYATLYGDMAGGFAVIKDVPKLLVYELCRHRNAVAGAELIPQSAIDKPPSAELRPGQQDTDSLPPYEVLDPILEAYVEHDRSAADIIADGFDAVTVRLVVRLVDRAEYKRRQAAPGVKVSQRAFGKDRRMPLTQRWSEP